MQNEKRIVREGETDISTRLTYFLIGGTVGALVALLFAPKSGRELRDDIADATRKGVDRTRDTAAQLGTKAGEYYEVTRDRASELYTSATQRARDAASRGGEQLSAAIDAGKQAYAEEKRRTESSGILEQGPTYYEGVKRTS